MKTESEKKTAQDLRFRQFLTDVITAAGLVAHGKQDKKFAERLSIEAVQLMKGEPK